MRQLTLVPEGGLCNRIYAVTSAVGFAQKHNLYLTVIWFKDWGMGAGFHDLFQLSPAIENVKIIEAGFIDFFKYAKPLKSNFFLPKLYQKMNFDAVYYWREESDPVEKWYYSHTKANKFFLHHCSKFYGNSEFLSVISPLDSIQKRINEQQYLFSNHTTGVHIRRTDFAASINHSPSPAFIERMQREIAEDPEANFYVASDSQEEKVKLINLFGNRIITVENNLKRNTKDGIVDALIELYSLASTKKIYGSYLSTYSLLASEINNIPIEIIKIDKNINNHS